MSWRRPERGAGGRDGMPALNRIFCSRLLPALLLSAAVSPVCAQPIVVETLPELPQPVSNNAVAAVATDRGLYLYSFMGLGGGKSWRDITASALVLPPGDTRWHALAAVPGNAGRLAASAAVADGAVWLFGGYTVAGDGHEVSTAGVYRIRPGDTAVQWVSDMPVPVDDAVAVSYQNRYIYLISGWHDVGNVNLVQVLDTHTRKWQQATPWPGAPVFGHAGGISGSQMLICDGVKIHYPDHPGPRAFVPSTGCWQGQIDADNHRRIRWQPVAPHPGPPRYRMASTGNADGAVIFAGGSANPYNFDGTGYNGEPAPAANAVFSYDFGSGRWRAEGELPWGSMDHRGMAFDAGWYYLVGGMNERQMPTATVVRFRLAGRSPMQSIHKEIKEPRDLVGEERTDAQ